MSNPYQVKVFDYKQTDEVNEFIKTVDLPAGNAINFRDQGIIIVYQEKRKQAGLTKQEHIDSVKDEIARAEAELADALLGLAETDLGFKNFNGKSGMKKIADAFLSQMKLDQDTVDNKKAKVVALRSLCIEIEEGRMPIGAESVKQLFDGEKLVGTGQSPVTGAIPSNVLKDNGDDSNGAEANA